MLTKGKSSNNSSYPTKVYTELVKKIDDNPDERSTSIFIDQYKADRDIDIVEYINKSKKEFAVISNEFIKTAEKVFGVSLNDKITVYLTVNNRCPYNIEEKWFFISLSYNFSTTIIMHELWHFYTWEKFGSEQDRIGKEKYNHIKEALTVLLNVECKHLFPEGVEDQGYPQHQELREKILDFWKEKPDIDFVWERTVLAM